MPGVFAGASGSTPGPEGARNFVSSKVPGLYFLGLHWMHRFKSGLLAGVGSDAEHLTEHMDLMTGPRAQNHATPDSV